MATEQSATAIDSNEDVAGWAGWIAALFGLWVLVSPFVLSGALGSGSALYSNVISGIVVAVLAGYAAWTHQADGHMAPAWSGWIAALAGLWILASPFFLAGPIGAGAALYSNVIAGVIALVLSAYAANEAL